LGLLVELDLRYGVDVFGALSWIPFGLRFNGDQIT
jgi:hypothetical protein